MISNEQISDFEKSGLCVVPRLISVRELSKTIGVSEINIRKRLGDYEHLMVKVPSKKVLFDAHKVLKSIESGDLRK